MKPSLPLYYLLIIITVISCSKENLQQRKTYFGGEIVNPKNNYVLLFKENEFIDSIPLDENHQFFYTFKNFKEGLYTFKHDEFQYLYLEPNDSLFLRLNTVDFDETLTFSGKGSHKNNFLIKTFLKNEAESENNSVLFNLPPQKFLAKLKYNQTRSHAALDKYATKYLFSDAFKTITNTHIDYQIYSLKEKYATINKNKKDFKLPDDYYRFRNDVDFNAHQLINFYPYSNYLSIFVNSISDSKHSCKSPLDSYTTKLKVIDSIIKDTLIKNNLFQKIGYSYYHKKDTPQNRATFLTTFKSYTDNQKLINQITYLSNKLKHLTAGTPFPYFEVLTDTNRKIAVQDLITAPTIVYFWTQNQLRHLKSVHEKVEKYSQKSNYQFIGICIDQSSDDWQKTLQKFRLENDYKLLNTADIQQKLMLNNIHKVFVLDKNGIILNTNLNLFDVRFLEKLKKI